MKKNEQTFAQLVDFLVPFLGDHNADKGEITLYDVINKPHVHTAIKAGINTITHKYKYMILSPGEHVTNVKILDIEL